MFVTCKVRCLSAAQEFRNSARSDTPPSVDPNRRLDGTSDDEETGSLVQNSKPETTPGLEENTDSVTKDLAIRSEI